MVFPTLSRQTSVLPMFAIVEIAGFQEKVEQGSKLKVPLHADENAGNKISFDKVLLLADGDSITFGVPYVAGAIIEAQVIKHGRDAKIRIQKAHRRKRYRRVAGHRQNFTEIEITKITTK